MPFPALLAQLRYNAERLHQLPFPVQSRADRKVLRELHSSTLDTLQQLYIARLAQPGPRPASSGLSTLERGLHQLRALERELLAITPGQEAPLVLWGALQQALGTLLAEVVSAYRYA